MSKRKSEKICEQKLPYIYKQYKEEVLRSRVLSFENKYLKLLENLKSTFRQDVEDRLSMKDWQKLIIRKTGVGIRCQGVRLHNKDVYIQCSKFAASETSLFCPVHRQSKLMMSKEKVLKEVEKFKEIGLFKGSQFKAFQEELKELETIPQEKFEMLDDEIKLVLALLRNILKNYSSEELRKKPQVFTGKDGIITRLVELKKAQHDIKFSPKVVFSREQVEYMFIKFKMAILEVISDKEMLQKLSDKFRLISLEAKADWKI